MLFKVPYLSKRNFNYAEKVIKKKYKKYIQGIEWDKGMALVDINDNLPHPDNLKKGILKVFENQRLFNDRTSPTDFNTEKNILLDELDTLQQLETITYQINGFDHLNILIYQIDEPEYLSMYNIKYFILRRFKEVKKIELCGNKLVLWISTVERKNHIFDQLRKSFIGGELISLGYPLKGWQVPMMSNNMKVLLDATKKFKEVKKIKLCGDKLVCWVTTTVRKKFIFDSIKLQNLDLEIKECGVRKGLHKHIYKFNIYGLNQKLTCPPLNNMKIIKEIDNSGINNTYDYEFLILCRSNQRTKFKRDISYQYQFNPPKYMSFGRIFQFMNKIFYFQSDKFISNINGLEKYDNFYLINNPKMFTEDIIRELNAWGVDIKEYRYEYFIPRDYQMGFMNIDLFKIKPLPLHRQQWYIDAVNYRSYGPEFFKDKKIVFKNGCEAPSFYKNTSHFSVKKINKNIYNNIYNILANSLPVRGFPGDDLMLASISDIDEKVNSPPLDINKPAYSYGDYLNGGMT